MLLFVFSSTSTTRTFLPLSLKKYTRVEKIHQNRDGSLSSLVLDSVCIYIYIYIYYSLFKSLIISSQSTRKKEASTHTNTRIQNIDKQNMNIEH